MTVTTNLSEFAWRELKLARDLLNAMIEEGLPSDFYDEKVEVAFNQNSGYVFLTNSDYHTALINPNTKVFLAQIQSCGVGMTLHSACYEIFYDKCFIPSSSIIQAEDRCHRIGMGDKCTIISLIAQGTVDEHWEEILSSKLSAADEILFDDKAEQRSKAEEIQPRFSKNITKEQLLNLIKIGQKGGV